MPKANVGILNKLPADANAAVQPGLVACRSHPRKHALADNAPQLFCKKTWVFFPLMSMPVMSTLTAYLTGTQP